MISKNKIIEHYKAFFELGDVELGQNDLLMIEWAEDLLKKSNVKPYCSFTKATSKFCSVRPDCENCNRQPKPDKD